MRPGPTVREGCSRLGSTARMKCCFNEARTNGPGRSTHWEVAAMQCTNASMRPGPTVREGLQLFAIRFTPLRCFNEARTNGPGRL